MCRLGDVDLHFLPLNVGALLLTLQDLKLKEFLSNRHHNYAHGMWQRLVRLYARAWQHRSDKAKVIHMSVCSLLWSSSWCFMSFWTWSMHQSAGVFYTICSDIQDALQLLCWSFVLYVKCVQLELIFPSMQHCKYWRLAGSQLDS